MCSAAPTKCFQSKGRSTKSKYKVEMESGNQEHAPLPTSPKLEATRTRPDGVRNVVISGRKGLRIISYTVPLLDCNPYGETRSASTSPNYTAFTALHSACGQEDLLGLGLDGKGKGCLRNRCV
jgi:hypothetical protein